MKKSRLFAPFLMLFAGAVASLMMYFFQYSMKQMLPRLLAVLLIFYLAGHFIQVKVSAFVNEIKEEERQKQEALEREAAQQEAAQGDEEESAGTVRGSTEDEA